MHTRMDKIMNDSTLGKKLITSLFSFALLITVSTGCSSVADANLDEDPGSATEVTSGNDNAGDDDIWKSNGDDMDPIVDRPPTPRGN